MRRTLMGLAAVVLFVGPAAAADKIDEKAEAAVKKAIAAHGGEKALTKYTAGRFNMKGEMSILGMDLDFTGKLSFATPDRFRMEMNSDIMGQKMVITQVVKGDKINSTVKVGDMTLPAADDEQKEELKLAAAMQEAERLTTLLDPKKFTIKSADEEEVNGKKATVVVVTPATVKREVKFLFDQKSGLLVKTSHKGKGPGEDGKSVEVVEDSYHLDYKEVNGIQVAMKLEVKHDDKKFMTVNVSDYEALEKIEDKEFATDD